MNVLFKFPRFIQGNIGKKSLKLYSTNHKEKYNKKQIEIDLPMTNWTFRAHMRLSAEPSGQICTVEYKIR